MNTSKRILIVRTGRPSPSVTLSHGDFAAWFQRLLAPGAVIELADAEAPLPSPSPYDGILLTGSLASVTDRTQWMTALAHWSLAAAGHRPVLGVCFGHQLLGWALGGRVERNPRGPDAGSRAVTLTALGAADPLFTGLPTTFLAPEAHEDHVAAVPPGARLLASSAQTPVESFAAGDHIRAVQFHPEFDVARSRAIVSASRRMLSLARPGGCSRSLGTVQPTPFAERVLANWLDGFVGTRPADRRGAC